MDYRSITDKCLAKINTNKQKAHTKWYIGTFRVLLQCAYGQTNLRASRLDYIMLKL